MWKDKFKAFLIHLAISLMIAGISLAIVYLVWNPAPLYKATGITRIFLLMLMIDIILGPVLTLIVYKKGKKTLKFDLTVIAILQALALSYGLYNVFEGRPAWIVYNVDRFDLVRFNEIDTRKINEAKPEYQSVSLTGPQFVSAIMPNDSETKNKILFEEIGQGIAFAQHIELYQNIDTAKTAMANRAISLSELDKFNASNLVKSVLSQYPEADSYLPLKANAVDMTVLINKKAGGEVIKIVDLRPWQ